MRTLEDDQSTVPGTHRLPLWIVNVHMADELGTDERSIAGGYCCDIRIFRTAVKQHRGMGADRNSVVGRDHQRQRVRGK